MNTDVLQSLGLEKNEARIYEALLGQGAVGVSRISTLSKVNRRNVYDSLKGLMQKRLVVRVIGRREAQYKSADPKVLEDIVKEQRKEAVGLLPLLNDLYQIHIPQEQAFISRGHEGIKNFWQYALSQHGPVYFVGGKGAWHDPGIEEDRKIYFREAKKKGIAIYGIFDYSIFKTGEDIYSKYDLDKIRFFPKDYSSSASYDICGDRVVMFVVPKERSILDATIFNIVSPSLADSYRVWFQDMWEGAEMINQSRSPSLV